MKKDKINIDIFSWLILILAVLSGIVLRWVNLTGESLWFDEIASFNISQSAWVDLFREVSHRDSAPPLFVILAKLWTGIFGTSEFSLRSLPAFIGTLGIFAVYSLARIYGGMRTALLAVVILAFHHFAIYYSQEFRAYGLLFTLTSLSFVLCRPWFKNEKVRKRDAALLGLVNILLMYTHYYGMLVVIFESAFFIFIKRPAIYTRQIKLWWVVQAWTVAGLGLWLPGLTDHAFHSEQYHLATGIDWHELFVKLSPFSGSMASEGGFNAVYLFSSLFFVLFALAFFGFKYYHGIGIKISNVKKDLKFLFKDKSFFFSLGYAYLFGAFLIGISYFPFLKADELPFFNWRELSWEAFILLSFALLAVLLGFCISNISVLEREVDSKGRENFVTVTIFSGFPIFVVLTVIAVGIFFRPNYTFRNMIVLLPSLICAVAWVISKIKWRTIWLLVVCLIFIGFSMKINDINKFKPKVDSRGIAQTIEKYSDEYGEKIPVVIFSLTAFVEMKHYLKGYKLIDGRRDLEKKLSKIKYSFWVLHDFKVPPPYKDEIDSAAKIDSYLNKNRIIKVIKRYGMNAVFLMKTD